MAQRHTNKNHITLIPEQHLKVVLYEPICSKIWVQKKFITCLRHGTFKDSFPLILSGNKGHNFVDDANYNTELEALCREIWHKPRRQRPTLGNIPDYAK